MVDSEEDDKIGLDEVENEVKVAGEEKNEVDLEVDVNFDVNVDSEAAITQCEYQTLWFWQTAPGTQSVGPLYPFPPPF